MRSDSASAIGVARTKSVRNDERVCHDRTRSSRRAMKPRQINNAARNSQVFTRTVCSCDYQIVRYARRGSTTSANILRRAYGVVVTGVRARPDECCAIAAQRSCDLSRVNAFMNCNEHARHRHAHSNRHLWMALHALARRVLSRVAAATARTCLRVSSVADDRDQRLVLFIAAP